MATNEFELWLCADRRQKSYLVNVLHWFHYRRGRLFTSWKQEEVLTWELLRALEILPQRLFARRLMEHVGSLSPAAGKAVRFADGAAMIEITPYPNLEMSGSKRNCRSDIGLGRVGERPNIWLEAKTARFKEAHLREQLDQQASAMTALLDGTPHVLVTLLPEQRSIAGYPNLSWNQVVSELESCIASLSRLLPEADLVRGYSLMAKELIDRIQSHPNRTAGWV